MGVAAEHRTTVEVVDDEKSRWVCSCGMKGIPVGSIVYPPYAAAANAGEWHRLLMTSAFIPRVQE